jgi:tripartite-type tricarboxylate transporter receptor subunit TctC
MKKPSMLMLASAVFATGLCTAGAYAAANYPVKPITFIVPIEAGSDGDLLSRPLVEKAAAILGKPIIVENKPGAGNSIGCREIHNARPDGYTIGMTPITILTNKLQGLMPYDQRDFTFLGTFYRTYANLYASTKTKQPFKTVQEVIAFAKAHPGDVALASAGVGSSLWIGAQAFISGTGVKLNVIPQAGAGGLSITQVAGGHADITVTHMAAAKAQMDAGNIKFLAVFGNERDPAFPDVPTMKDLGYDVFWDSSGYVIAPPKLPKDVVEILTKAFAAAASDPEYHKFLKGRFADPFVNAPDKIVPALDEKQKLVRVIMEKSGILKDAPK